ncbi:AAA family ATPase [Bacillus toyonensis]|uniref:AAA family ATPase n=1 Tax=Bacillus toyonensis TaxID=155322 RepID=UPI000BF9BC53|nr:AAA family ATPase [Bacillus toyonensis]PGC86198.1 NTP-binding protein [Bacillus toyonensis]
MTQYSYSRVSLFNDCPYHFRLRYIDKLTEIPDLTRADNPLIIGHALHSGIEHDVETALNEYYNSFPVMNDAIVEESMKLEILIPKVQEFLSKNFEGCELIHEYKIDKPNYIGFVDLIVQAPDGTCMVIDFKYSNYIKNYMDSAQLHIYRDYLKQDGFNVERLAYLFVPKTSIKKKQDEDLHTFRKRLVQAVEESNLTFVPIEFDDMKTIYFLNNIDEIEKTKDFSKRNKSKNCFACNPRFRPNYLEAIENAKGEIEMILPENKRREKKIDTKPDLWIYADSYTGKSTFVDKVENVLFLNTDGNTDNTTAPVISIKDEVTKKGRVTSRKLAWDLFLDVVAELEAEDNDFEAVSIDLVEDLYEHCRVYVFDKNGWEHESDGTYGKGWSMVTTEFNNAMKRLKALGYQIIYISKEKVEEYTLKGGAKRTTFKPNINDKVANFLSGTVDLTLRAYVDSDDKRFLQLAKKQNVFGGGRYDFQVDTIPLEMDAFIEELTAAQEGNEGQAEKPKRERKKKEKQQDEENVAKKTMYFQHEGSEDFVVVKKGESLDFLDNDIFDERTKKDYEKWLAENQKEFADDEPEEKPKRERRSRKAKEENEEPAAEEKPKRQRRQRKPVEDDTPPGEANGDVQSEDEAPKRRTRRKRGE